MSVEVRAIRDSEVDAFAAAIPAAFLGDSSSEHVELFKRLEDVSRSRAAFDGSDLVATLGAFNLELAIPGTTLATAGTTHITVRPTHRRRGLLNEMIQQHFANIRERGEALAALWASESGIYRRYGYGSATELLRVSVERAHAVFETEVSWPGECRLVDAKAASTLIPQIYETLWRERPGHFARIPEWWSSRQLLDHPEQREGMSKSRFAIYEEKGVARGYAQYRVKEGWGATGIPQGQLSVVEMQGPPAARAALWRLLLDVDLVKNVLYWNDAVDSELPWLLSDSRRVIRGVRDAIWLRLMDVPRALEARSYAVEDRIVFGVRDSVCSENQGTHELDAGPAGAKCQHSSSAADLELDISDLGSVFLGGHSFFELAKAGRVRGEHQAILRADRMFHSPIAPWCPEIF